MIIFRKNADKCLIKYWKTVLCGDTFLEDKIKSKFLSYIYCSCYKSISCIFAFIYRNILIRNKCCYFMSTYYLFNLYICVQICSRDASQDVIYYAITVNYKFYFLRDNSTLINSCTLKLISCILCLLIFWYVETFWYVEIY